MSSPDQPWVLTTDPVLRALAEAATQLTGGAAAWIVARQHSSLHVVAAVGEPTAAILGAEVPGGEGTVGYVAATGEPLALKGNEGGDWLAKGICGLLPQPPAAVLCVPCLSDDGIAGVLEVVDLGDGNTFTVDDLEEATILASVAGAALTSGASSRKWVLSPPALGAELQRVADVDPDRYNAISAVMSALLANG